MTAPVTALYAGLLGMLLIILAILVVRQRVKHKVVLGTGRSRELECAVRTHANAAEYIPIAVVLMFLLEVNGGKPWVLHTYGATFLAARALHAFGLSGNPGTSPGRFLGTLVSWMVIVGLAAVDIGLFPRS